MMQVLSSNLSRIQTMAFTSYLFSWLFIGLCSHFKIAEFSISFSSLLKILFQDVVLEHVMLFYT